MSHTWISWSRGLPLLVAGCLAAGCSPPVAKRPTSSANAPRPDDSAAARQAAEASPSSPVVSATEDTVTAAASDMPEDVRVDVENAPAVSDGNRGRQLYDQHCAACHGENGNGQGLAARFLYPKPRDFRAGRFRLISTTNGVPTSEDLEAVLLRGMPGSSMVSWAHLPAEDRRLLIETVLLLRREGAADLERQLAAEADEELTEDDLAERVDLATTADQPFEPGDLPTTTVATIDHGKQLYVSKGCAACHGLTGRGDGQQQMIDAEGFATRPRDLTLGIYKGDHDRLSVYRRIWLGLPGSPMPASQNLSQEEVAAMVDFVLSLSDEATRESWVLRRRQLRATRVPTLAAEPGEEVWASVPVIEIQLTPLWWREGATPRVAVQAAHDGQELALRMAWDDPTPDERAVLPDEFEDMVAAQFYAGPTEPFLGMGAATVPIDLWQWRAGYRADGAEDQLSDEYPFDTPVYAELLGTGTATDFLTARAVGNPLAARTGTAGSLTAKGFGSTTFRPKASQLVEASGLWREGRWTVVLRRALAVPTEGGLTIASGERYAVAWAVWDGAARDRAGQKLITLWHDLILE